MSDAEPRRILEPEQVAAVLAAPLAVIYKHSPYCGLSTLAAREVRAFMASCPDVPVYMVDVIRDRRASAEVERRSGIRHESPQVIVIRDGVPCWSASHRGVEAGALERHAGGFSSPRP